MSTIAPGESAIDRFDATLGGRLIRPGDRDYDEARAVWNGMFDLHPGLIARCESASDVVRAVDFARQNEMEVAVRAGGHSVSGKSTRDGGLVIDLSPMNRVEVDPQRKIARVDGGALGRDFDEATQLHGLAATMGTDSTTGVGGLTLGGGIGFLARSCGLACDNLVAAELVLADGSFVRASESENSDLLWAIRGGGGNFGIVTSFEFRLHEIGPEVLVAQIFHPFSEAREVLSYYADFMSRASDEVGCYALVVNVPPVEPFPDAFHGERAVVLACCYAGAVDEGEAALRPLAEFGNPFLKLVTPMPYAALQQAFDASNPAGKRYYWKSQFLRQLSDGAIDVIVKHGDSLPGPFSAVFLEPMGGTVNRIAGDATAFPHRDAAFNLGISAGWEDAATDDQAIEWARQFHAELTPFSTGGVYVNYLDRDDGARLQSAYGENMQRLRRIKAKYDPDNFFSTNQNIGPEQ